MAIRIYNNLDLVFKINLNSKELFQHYFTGKLQ